MRLLFSRSYTPGSALIRLATWSVWSHIGVVIGDRVLDATWRYGVAMRPVDDFFSEASEVAGIEVDTHNPFGVINALRSQLGRPYDISAILGLAFRRDWQEDDSWFCSELVAWAYERSGQPLFRQKSLYRITPQNLWLLPEVVDGRN